MAAVNERDIVRYLVKGVKELAGEIRKVQWIGRHAAPDTVVMIPCGRRIGRYSNCPTVWVELKAPGEAAKPHQLREHKRMRSHGQIVLVIDSFAGVDELLR